MSESSSHQQPPNPWHYKPWWCQPWSIVLTGIGTIGASWLPFHQLWLTLLVAVPILIWMGFFLLLWPRLILQSGMLAPEPPFESDAES